MPVTTPRKSATKRKPTLDLRFQTFGKWFVQGRASGKGKARFWVCQCECGKTTAEIHEDAMVEGRAKSCGCDYGCPGGRFNDLTGQQIGEYLVLYRGESKHRVSRWHCQCQRCGAEKDVFASALKNPSLLGCMSCAMRARAPLAGQVFGDLVVLQSTGVAKNKIQIWECLCRCGNKTKVTTGNLLAKQTTSCGCKHTRKAKESVQSSYGWWDIVGPYMPAHVNSNSTVQKYVRAKVLCRCRGCGVEKQVFVGSLKQGKSHSCHACSKVYRASLVADLDTWDTMITASAQRQKGVQA